MGDGQIFDCDFNQQVELYPIANAFKRKRQKEKQDTDTKSSVKLNTAVTKGISVFDIDCTDDMLTVPVATGLHCRQRLLVTLGLSQHSLAGQPTHACVDDRWRR